MNLLTVTVFSDYICPFCYVGERRLAKACEGLPIIVEWQPLEIHPGTPAEGMPLERLGYPPAQWARMMAALQEMAREEGLEIAERVFTTNSHRALLLAEAAKEQGKTEFGRLHEALFRGFFTERRNIGDPMVLREIASEAGLEPALCDEAWTASRFEARLAGSRELAGRLGVTGTPCFRMDGRLIAGAVPAVTLAAALRAALVHHA